jgi:hypothetical protein
MLELAIASCLGLQSQLHSHEMVCCSCRYPSIPRMWPIAMEMTHGRPRAFSRRQLVVFPECETNLFGSLKTDAATYWLRCSSLFHFNRWIFANCGASKVGAVVFHVKCPLHLEVFAQSCREDARCDNTGRWLRQNWGVHLNSVSCVIVIQGFPSNLVSAAKVIFRAISNNTRGHTHHSLAPGPSTGASKMPQNNTYIKSIVWTPANKVPIFWGTSEKIEGKSVLIQTRAI